MMKTMCRKMSSDQGNAWEMYRQSLEDRMRSSNLNDESVHRFYHHHQIKWKCNRDASVDSKYTWWNGKRILVLWICLKENRVKWVKVNDRKIYRNDERHDNEGRRTGGHERVMRISCKSSQTVLRQFSDARYADERKGTRDRTETKIDGITIIQVVLLQMLFSYVSM